MICPNCGKGIEEGQKFCTSCGTELNNIETNNNNVATEDDTKTKIIVILICFAILVFATILGILVSKNQTVSMTTQLNDEQSTTSIVNCDDYENLNVYDEKYASGYIECTLDEKIKKLNDEYKFKEQVEYWDNINSIIEHTFDNIAKYEDREPRMYGKYDTMDKLDLAVYKEYKIYELGRIALGQDEYAGPDYMYGNAGWQDYLEVAKGNNENFGKLRPREQKELAEKIQKLTQHISKKFYNDYYKNVYITELMGIEDNALADSAKKILKTTINLIYNPKTNDFLPELTKKAEAIEAYNNLVIDNVAFAEAYKKARAYADEHIEDKDEDGNYMNTGNGAYEGLIYSYFKENDNQYTEVYDIIWDYCYAIQPDAAMVDIRNCLFNELEKLATGEK